jgi:maltose alpha-D-glucosyltransferase / alpha-amylase
MVKVDPTKPTQAIVADQPVVSEQGGLETPATTRIPIETPRAGHGQKASHASVKSKPWFERLDREDTRKLLTEYVAKQRWFGGKARDLLNVAVEDLQPLPGPRGQQMFLGTVRAEYAEGDPERYVMVLSAAKGTRGAKLPKDAVIGSLGGKAGVLYDAMRTEDGARAFATLIQEEKSSGEIVGSPTSAWKSIDPAKTKFEVGSAEQSNTSVRIGKDYMIKLLRRQSDGLNPDLEVGRFLTESAAFDRVPNVTGAIEKTDGSTVAMVVSLVPGAKDAWELTLEALGDRSFEKKAATLGRRTAELHLALRSRAAEQDPAFAPEPLTQADLTALAERMRGNLSRVLKVLEDKRGSLPEATQAQADRLLAGKDTLLAKIDALTAKVPEGAIKTRVHGDYHLGQVLVDHTREDFFIIDFEGEPTRPLAERRMKQAPEKDVAGMLRSFDYAGRAGIGDELERLPAAQEWSAAMQKAFLEGYLEAVGAKEASPLLEAYVLDKAIYELDYELNNRKAWAGIPLGALLASI